MERTGPEEAEEIREVIRIAAGKPFSERAAPWVQPLLHLCGCMHPTAARRRPYAYSDTRFSFDQAIFAPGRTLSSHSLWSFLGFTSLFALRAIFTFFSVCSPPEIQCFVARFDPSQSAIILKYTYSDD